MSDKYVCTLSKELREKAEKELNETEEWRNRDIKALRERVLNNKALTCRTDSKFLLMFLRARKFDYERSYELLVNYFKIRAKCREQSKEFALPTIAKVLDCGMYQWLPYPDQYGRPIGYQRPGKWDPTKHSTQDNRIAGLMLTDLYLQEDETSQINGTVSILNLEGMGWEHVKHLNLEWVQEESSALQNCIPARVKEIHILNEPGLCSAVVNLFKSLLKSKMAARIHCHGTDRKRLITEFGITPEVLPSEVGGSLPHGDELAKKFNERMSRKESYFTEQQQFTFVLPRSISSSTRSDPEVAAIGGLSGTFKKLNVD